MCFMSTKEVLSEVSLGVGVMVTNLMVPGHCTHQGVVIGEGREIFKVAPLLEEVIGQDWTQENHDQLLSRIDGDLATIAAIECARLVSEESVAQLGADVRIISLMLEFAGDVPSIAKVVVRISAVAEGVLHLIDHASTAGGEPVEELLQEWPDIADSLNQ